MSTHDAFWAEFKKRFSRLPVWLPGTASISIGDVGVMDRGGWNGLYNLKKDFGIDYESSKLTDVKQSYRVDSDYATTVPLDVSAKTAEVLGPLAAAGLNFKASFERGGGFVVRAYNARGTKIGNLGRVHEQIAARDAHERFWDRRWILVTEVVTAAPIAVLVSSKSNASATVTASADVVQGTLAEAAVNLGATVSPNIDQAFTSVKTAPFLWRGQWRGRWLSNRLRDLGSSDEEVSAGVVGLATDAEYDKFESFNSPELLSMSEEEVRKLADGGDKS